MATRGLALQACRKFSSSSCALSSLSTSAAGDLPQASSSRDTYYKITLTRSAIALGARKKGTLVSLGLHRRLQTVFHPHSPEFAGKILAVKELVKVENVPKEAVRTKTEQRQERRPSQGFEIVDSLQSARS